MNKINEKQDEKTGRAKRADLDAMQERFEAIKKVVNSGMDTTAKLDIIVKIADGKTLNEVILEAGKHVLGLNE